ncbi:hypothetical protein DW958_00465 [Ruminococcus sp. AM46-18]|nr:hypothetical protein DW958_00465 [Ruminococcus sp. AM46-18]
MRQKDNHIKEQIQVRACLKNHSRNLHAPTLRDISPESVAVARYGALIRAKYPTNCDAHLAESLFQTRSNVLTLKSSPQRIHVLCTVHTPVC